MADNNSGSNGGDNTMMETTDACLAKQKLMNLRQFIDARPGLLVVDPLPLVEVIMNRLGFLNTLHSAHISCAPFTPWCLLSHSIPPPFTLDTGVRYPVIVKTCLSCGHPSTHVMVVVHSEPQLLAVPSQLGTLNTTLLLQNWIVHDGFVWKIYVIGEKVWIAKRTAPIAPPDTVFTIDSQSSGQPTLDSAPATFLSSDRCSTDEASCTIFGMAMEVSKALGLTLFGFDVVRDVETKQFYLIDVNFFPGYKEVTNVNGILLDYLRQRIHTHKEEAHMKKKLEI
jgi:inositol-1,3,4-trisphosphate 5/6-kinase/inositol-tetrakisphosphate 1-kinase